MRRRRTSKNEAPRPPRSYTVEPGHEPGSGIERPRDLKGWPMFPGSHVRVVEHPWQGTTVASYLAVIEAFATDRKGQRIAVLRQVDGQRRFARLEHLKVRRPGRAPREAQEQG